MKKTLNLTSVAGLYGGALGIAAETTLSRVLLDCYERPGVTTDREVTIKIKVSPVWDVKAKSLGGVKKLRNRSRTRLKSYRCISPRLVRNDGSS